MAGPFPPLKSVIVCRKSGYMDGWCAAFLEPLSAHAHTLSLHTMGLICILVCVIHFVSGPQIIRMLLARAPSPRTAAPLNPLLFA